MELTCIKCGEKAAIQMDLTDGDTLFCPECNQDFTVADVEACIQGWQRLVGWMRQCPSRVEEPAQV